MALVFTLPHLVPSPALIPKPNIISSFGKTACGQWSIGKNFPYLWDVHSWWICDCSAMKEVLEYKETTPMVCGWAQKRLVCHFNINRRSNKMVFNVDSITRHFGNLISHYITIATLLSSLNYAKHPLDYDVTEFRDLGNVNITETDNPSRKPPPFLTSDVLHRIFQIPLIHPQLL